MSACGANSFGWSSFAQNPPRRRDLLLEMHDGREKFVARLCDLNPALVNKSELWWRLTGIAKEQLEHGGEWARLINGEVVVLPADAVMGAEMLAPEQRKSSGSYAGACWNAPMEEESKESVAQLYIDALRELRKLRGVRPAPQTLFLECPFCKAKFAFHTQEQVDIMIRRHLDEHAARLSDAGETMPDGYRAAAQKGESHV